MVLAAASCAATSIAQAPNPVPVAGATDPPAVGFVVCPPGPVSDRADVELRVGIRNGGSSHLSLTVRFTLAGSGRRKVLRSVRVGLRPGQALLVSHWWATSGSAGRMVPGYEVRDGRAVLARGTWPVDVYHSEHAALPWPQCLWLDPGNLMAAGAPGGDAQPADIRAMTDAMRAVGASLILVSYVESVAFGSGAYYPSTIPELGTAMLPFDALGVLLDQADRNGQHVILGIGRGPDLNLVYEGMGDPGRLQRAIDLARRVGTELSSRYGHHRSFYGWYLSHEPADLDAAGAFLNPVTDHLHSLAPEKPVVVAPSGTPILSPQVLSAARYDVLTYQDAVGPGYVPYRYTWDPENRLATLDDVYRAYWSDHLGTRKHIWSDTETWEMAGPTYGQAYPAAFARVLRQMRAERPYVDMMTAYEFLGTMRPPGMRIGPRDPRSEDLYRQYRAHYERELAAARSATTPTRTAR